MVAKHPDKRNRQLSLRPAGETLGKLAPRKKKLLRTAEKNPAKARLSLS